MLIDEPKVAEETQAEADAIQAEMDGLLLKHLEDINMRRHDIKGAAIEMAIYFDVIAHLAASMEVSGSKDVADECIDVYMRMLPKRIEELRGTLPQHMAPQPKEVQ